MAALPENYVTLLQLRERWHKRQQEAEESATLDARPERCEGNDRKKSTDGRTPVCLSGKDREKEENRAGDIADRRRSYYWWKNKDAGGGEGRGQRGIAVPVAEGSSREQRCTGRSESEVRAFYATSKDGWELPHEKEIVEASCFAGAVVEGSNGKEVKRGDCRTKSSDQWQRSFRMSDSGPARAKGDDAGGNWPRSFGRNDPGGNWTRTIGSNGADGKDNGGGPRELAAFAKESGALGRPSTRSLDHKVRLEAQKSVIPPVDSGGIMRSAIVDGSGGKEVKSEIVSVDGMPTTMPHEAFHKKNGAFKGKRHGKYENDAGVVGAEGQEGVNWQRRPLKRNDDAGIGNGRRQRDVVVSVTEIVPLEQRIPRRSNSELLSVDGMPTTVPHEAFHKKSHKSKEKRHGKYEKDAGGVGAKGQGGGNWQLRPLKRNEDANIGCGLSQRDVVASVAEIVPLEQRSPRRSDSELLSVDGMPTTVPHEAFFKKSRKSKKKKRVKYKKDAGVVGLEEGQGEGNWELRPLQRNKDAGIGYGISRRDVVASVAEIVALGQRRPRRLDSEVVSCDHMLTSVPDVLESPSPEKELVRSVCFTGTIVEASSAKEKKSSNKERKKPDVVRVKFDEDWLDNMTEDAPVEAMKEECRGDATNSGDYLKRSNNYQQKGFKKTKPGMAPIREEEEQVGKLANGHNMPLEAVTFSSRKVTERVASEGKALNVNGGGRVISGPRNHRFAYRERIVVKEDNETQKDFSGDKEAINQEVEPANKCSRTEGKLGEKPKNDISSKEMVFRSDEGELMLRLRDFSIGSSGRRGSREQRLPPLAEKSHSRNKRNSGRKNGDSAYYMDRDMVWVKK